MNQPVYLATLSILSFSLLSPFCSFGQRDSNQTGSRDTAELKDVVVSGIIPGKADGTSWNISSLSQQEMRNNGAFMVSDALTLIPGVSQISTGIGISKPVIRGLYGTRVLTVLSGLRFDNQQWQDEHGLGLNDMGIDRVEVIKGPSALLYGSEAMGGVLNVIEEPAAKPFTTVGDLNMRLFSNTYGVFTDMGIKGATAKYNWQLRAGLNSQADYSDGGGERVLNSRFSGYYIKAGGGFTKKRWQSNNHYSGSFDRFGFITGDNLESIKPDGRLSRSMDGPHHAVMFHIFNSENVITLKNSRLKVNGGFQSNLRMENESGNRVSLKMLLTSGVYNLQWIKRVSPVTQVVLGNNFLYQNNTNYGSRIIIPDANTLESGAAVFMKNQWNRLILESGIGASLRNIRTFRTGNLNQQDNSIMPFNKTYPVVNGTIGVVFKPFSGWNIKVNAGSGFRSGNLAELSSNGLHEGTLRYEIGDPNLKIEKNINTEAEISFQKSGIFLSAQAFFNQFFNYIFLAPTGDRYLGFEVFRYKQENAHLSGGELSIRVNMPFYYPLEFDGYYSTVEGKQSNGSYLPFIPSGKLHTGFQWHTLKESDIRDIKVLVSADTYMKQDRVAPFESVTTGYTLICAGASFSWIKAERTISLGIMANNLLNKRYYDHLSRLKDYGIYNIGRNITLNIHLPFSLH